MTKKNWDDLTPAEEFQLVSRAYYDIVFFCESPWFCGEELFLKKKEIVKEFGKYEYTCLSCRAVNPEGETKCIKCGGSQLDYLRKYNELLMQAGMGGGKSFIGGLLTAHEAFKLTVYDPYKRYNLAKGSLISLINCASKEKQGKETIFQESINRIRYNRYFKSSKFKDKETGKWLIKIQKNDIYFPLIGVDLEEYDELPYAKITNIGSSGNSEVGRTVKIVVFDEITKFRDNEGRFSGDRMYNLVSKSTGRFSKWVEDIKVLISSPMEEGDILDTKIREAKERKLKHVLSFSDLPSFELNKNITEESLRELEAKDPESYARDILGIATKSKGNFFKNKEILVMNADKPNCIDWNPALKNGDGWWEYFIPENFNEIDFEEAHFVLAGDPAFSNDAFGICLMHREWDESVEPIIKIDEETGEEEIDKWVYHVDILWRILGRKKVKKKSYAAMLKREVTVDEIIALFKEIVNLFPVEHVVFDTYQFPSIRDEMEIKEGIPVVQNVVRIPEYNNLKDKFFHGRMDVCAYPHVMKELRQLIKMTDQRIDHPKYGSKDCADAMANALWLCSGEWEYEQKKSKQKPKTNIYNWHYVRGAPKRRSKLLRL